MTAKDVMTSQSQKQPSNIKYIALETKTLEGNTKYTRCPKCWKLKKNQGKQNDVILGELQPLVYKRVMEITTNAKGEEQKYIDEFYKCLSCGQRIETMDFVTAYCCRADGSKYGEKPIGYTK